ncbi:glycine oxidase ThiO [Actinomadura macrotermitis]|uniref:glycine oxidase n=1 Tax=Actinomadura macrotermitis TaxID=2585200 RepID=A0A7K0C8K5_9ACTN|nr:glycine oxidase ThiO [Actinomadura macrotermitis]MQY09703.1 Hydrogen cyanide synthase subunit HcnC [Actinomadura macrotermitis]
MHVVIVGGGVIGLSTAWRALERGLEVTVVDPAPGSEASHASAGMLPPANELILEQEDLLRLCLSSRERYPAFVAGLEAVSGRSVGFRRDGVLDVAFDQDGLAALEEVRKLEESLGIAIERLDPGECLAHEPALAPTVTGGLLAPDDGAIDPREMTPALLAAIDAHGGLLLRERAIEVIMEGDRAAGVRLAGGASVRGDKIVLAAGCWTHGIGGLPPGVVPEIRPVKGQILRLRSAEPYLRRTTRAVAGGSAVYLVPRSNGELVVGATYEERGYDTTVTAGGVCELLDKARKALPGVGALELAEAGVGLRPAAPDDLPVLGATAVPGLLLVTGHSRIGVQLTPVTADLMAGLLADDLVAGLAEPFAPTRFAG